MLIDHTTKAVLYNCVMHGGLTLRLPSFIKLSQLYNFLRGVGRLAFPIYCFMIIEGFIHTRNRLRYFLRLLLFGFISEIPFDFGLYERIYYPKHQNVMFELALGLLMIWVWDELEHNEHLLKLNNGIRLMIQGASAAAFLITAQKLHLDYGFKGLALIMTLYLLRFDRVTQCTAGALNIGIWEWPAVFSFPILCLYNGTRGKQIKYLFYVIYPAHLLLLGLLTVVLKNGI